MLVIESLLGNISEYNAEKFDLDTVVLTKDQLQKMHQKLRSQDGSEYALSLPEGEALSEGDVIYKDEHKIVLVESAIEDVLVIHPSDNIEWAKTAFNIGNFHHAAFLCQEHILTPYDPVLESVLQKIGVKYERDQRRLAGERAAVRQGHHHGG